MELSVYQRQEHPGEFLLTPAIMTPCIDAEHRYGPLVYLGTIETDSSADAGDWTELVCAIERCGYTVLASPGEPAVSRDSHQDSSLPFTLSNLAHR